MEEKKGKLSEEGVFKKLEWDLVWEKYRLPIALGFVGLILVGIGTFSTLLLTRREPELEIIPVEKTATTASILVDLEGAVEKPGLYELPADSRFNDLLTRAGGLSVQADREWLEKNLNLAQKLVDGAKIYIPRTGEAGLKDSSGKVAGESASILGKVNLNTTSISELDSLWGIGEKRAQSIIDNRPYQSIEELKTKKIIPSNVFEKIKEQITVY